MKSLLAFIIFIGAIFSTFTVLANGKEFSFWRQRGDSESISALKQINTTGIKDGDKEDWLLDVIRWVTNRVLWILGFIALVLALYGWFIMVTSAWDDDKYSNWRWILKSALIWLAIIWLAWFVVSIILWLIQNSGTEAAWTEWWTG
jgi:hypothetical protein